MRSVRFVVLACLALTVAGCDRTRPGRRAPGLAVEDLRGKAVSLAALKGRVVLVGFFASWAPPCRLAMLTWGRHQRAWGRRGLVVLGIAVHEERAVLERVLKAAPPGFTVGIGTEAVVETWLGKTDQVLPTAFLVDGKGRILARYQGVHPGDAMTADIERAVAALPARTSTEGQ